MKFSTASLSVATLSLAMLVPALGQTPSNNWQNGQQSRNEASSQSWQNGQQSSQNWKNNQQSGFQKAEDMVAARASLSHTLDADNTKPGYQFRARLSKNVRLDNGVKLQRGDTLIGKVVTDDMHTAGRSRLALRFTQAVLKDGQTIPIKATIVGLYTPSQLNNNSYDESEQIPNTWTDKTLRVDEINVTHDVDLHSNIASRNSGVFVSTEKDNVKIPRGSELALAISPRQNAGTMTSMSHGS